MGLLVSTRVERSSLKLTWASVFTFSSLNRCCLKVPEVSTAWQSKPMDFNVMTDDKARFLRQCANLHLCTGRSLLVPWESSERYYIWHAVFRKYEKAETKADDFGQGVEAAKREIYESLQQAGRDNLIITADYRDCRKWPVCCALNDPVTLIPDDGRRDATKSGTCNGKNMPWVRPEPGRKSSFQGYLDYVALESMSKTVVPGT
jgi:hypothetical protein